MVQELAPVVNFSLHSYKEDLSFKLNSDCNIDDATSLNGTKGHDQLMSKATPKLGAYPPPGEELFVERLAGSYAKLASCYRMIEQRELSYNFQFQYIVRLRPDMLFLSPVPPLKQLFPRVGRRRGRGHARGRGRANASNSVIIPIAVGGAHYKGVSYNDHMAVCSRSAAAAYFLVSEDIRRCSGNFTAMFGYSLGTALFGGKLEKHNANVQRMRFAYSLMRLGARCRADCTRLYSLWQGALCNDTCKQYVAQCKQLEVAICTRCNPAGK